MARYPSDRGTSSRPLCRRATANGRLGGRGAWTPLRQSGAEVVVHVEMLAAIRTGRRFFDVRFAAVSDGHNASARLQWNGARTRPVEFLDHDLGTVAVNGKIGRAHV